MKEKLEVNIHSCASWERGFRIVIVDSVNSEMATCITLENGSDEEAIISRVRQAFVTLANGVAA